MKPYEWLKRQLAGLETGSPLQVIAAGPRLAWASAAGGLSNFTRRVNAKPGTGPLRPIPSGAKLLKYCMVTFLIALLNMILLWDMAL